MAKLSILGLYNFNPDVFSDFNTPEGIDKQTVIDRIILDCYDLELLFPSYNLMKIAIKNWTAVEGPIWQKLYNSENLVYNPLWNVDADISETRSVTRAKSGTDNRTVTQNGSDSDTIHRESEFGINESTSGSEITDRDTSGTTDNNSTVNTNDSTSGTTGNKSTVNTNDSTSGTNQNTHSQAGYNSSTLVITEQDDGTTSTTGQGSRTETGSGTTSTTGQGSRTETGSGKSSETVDEKRTTTETKTGTDTEETDETRSGTRTNTETGSGTNSENETVGETLTTRRTGNIGVTSSQQLIREERDVATFSTIKYISDSFKRHFCLLVY